MHNRLVEEFGGKDLPLILGKKSDRRPIEYFSPSEIQSRIEKLYSPYMKFSKTENINDSAIVCLKMLQLSGLLQGVDLKFITEKDAPQWGLKQFTPTDKMYLNYKIQRGIDLKHIAGLIFKFNINDMSPGLGRRRSDGIVFNNDGQHRAIPGIIHGLTSIPLNVRDSDDELVDFDQYCSSNVENLGSEQYDNYRNRSGRGTYCAENDLSIRHDDKEDYRLKQIFAKHDTHPVSKKDKKGQEQPGAIHGFDKIRKFSRQPFNLDVFEAGLKFLRETWPEDKAVDSTLGGLICLFDKNNQYEKFKPVEFNEMSFALIKKWNRPGLAYRESFSWIKEQFGEESWENKSADPHLRIASGIYSVLKQDCPDIEIARPTSADGRTVDVKVPLM